MSDIIIIVKPAVRNGKRLHDHVDAYLGDTGELLVKASRQPTLDAARVLLDRGYLPNDTIVKVWAHAPEIVTMRASVGIAAQYDVMGEKFVRRKATADRAVGADLSSKRSTSKQ